MAVPNPPSREGVGDTQFYEGSACTLRDRPSQRVALSGRACGLNSPRLLTVQQAYTHDDDDDDDDDHDDDDDDDDDHGDDIDDVGNDDDDSDDCGGDDDDDDDDDDVGRVGRYHQHH